MHLYLYVENYFFAVCLIRQILECVRCLTMLERGFRQRKDGVQIPLIEEPGKPCRNGPTVFDRTSYTEFHNQNTTFLLNCICHHSITQRENDQI